jgi:hypothetical protein
MLIKLYFLIFKFFQTFFYLVWDYKIPGDFEKKKLRAERSSGRPQYVYSLARMAYFGIRVSKNVLSYL